VINTPKAINISHLVLLRDLSPLRESLSKMETTMYRGNTLTTIILMLTLYESGRTNTKLTIKQLCTSNVRSQQSYRAHLDQLVKDGWVMIESGVVDKRQSVVLPTEKLLQFIGEINLLPPR
jgi:DNA-binding MarR family transcriptional regulator